MKTIRGKFLFGTSFCLSSSIKATAQQTGRPRAMKSPILRIILAVCLSLFAEAAIYTRAQKAELVVQTGHTAQVHSVAVSPDGLTIASGSSDRTVKLWEATTGKLLRTLSGHTGRIFAVAFSTDSQIVASGGQSGEIKLWDRSSGSEIAAFRSKLQVVACLTFSPDRRILASGGIGSAIQFWDLGCQRSRIRL